MKSLPESFVPELFLLGSTHGRVEFSDVSERNDKTQEESIRHMGPMAQDFHAAFGLGEDERRISIVDSDGVALAAIQGLHEVVKEKEEEIQALKNRMTRKDVEFEKMKVQMEQIMILLK
jgi:hypothetical protein